MLSGFLYLVLIVAVHRSPTEFCEILAIGIVLGVRVALFIA
jgi:hypothetical protein